MVYGVKMEVLGLLLYCLPTIFALMRGSRHVGMIALVNILLGWTVVMWFVALFWAFAGQSETKHAEKAVTREVRKQGRLIDTLGRRH